MTINYETKEGQTTVCLEGRLDTNTSLDYSKFFETLDPKITDLVLDLEKLTYITSAGLRVILNTHKELVKKSGNFVVKNCNEMVMEVFDMTGFSDVLNIK